MLRREAEREKEMLKMEMDMMRGAAEREKEIIRGELQREKEMLIIEWKEKASQEEKAKNLKEYKRRFGALRSMCQHYGWERAYGKSKQKGWAAELTGRSDRLDEDLLEAALGFWLGSQKECIPGRVGRAGSNYRKQLLCDIAKFAHEGEL